MRAYTLLLVLCMHGSHAMDRESSHSTESHSSLIILDEPSTETPPLYEAGNSIRNKCIAFGIIFLSVGGLVSDFTNTYGGIHDTRTTRILPNNATLPMSTPKCTYSYLSHASPSNCLNQTDPLCACDDAPPCPLIVEECDDSSFDTTRIGCGITSLFTRFVGLCGSLWWITQEHDL